MYNLKAQTHSHPRKSHRSIALRPFLIDSALVLAILIVIALMWKGPAILSPLPLIGSGQFPGASGAQLGTTTPALIVATYDQKPQIRSDAIYALGSQGDLAAFPRIRMLQVTDGNEYVQQAARRVEIQLIVRAAESINLPATSIKDIAVAPSGVAYLATIQDLYVRRDGTWEYMSHLPDATLGLALSADGETLYLATAMAGLFSSQNGGATWKYVAFGLNTPTQLIATAVAADPKDAKRAYIALVTPGVGGKTSPLGIFWTQDAGETWRYLENSPVQAITRLLVVDPEQPDYIFGVADDTPWRYALPHQST